MSGLHPSFVLRATLLGVGALLCLLPAPGWADYAGSFREGLRAVDFKDWGRAERLMREAIAQQPAGVVGTSLRVYGTRFERYLPYYYLGLALYRQGDCRGALEAIGQAGAAAAVGGVQRGKLRLFEAVCRVRLGLPQGPQRPPRPPSVPHAGSPTASRTSPRASGRPSGGPTSPTRSGSTSATRPSTGSSSTSPTNRPTNPRTGPSSGPPIGTSKDVHRRQLEKIVGQAEEELQRGEALAGSLETRRRAGAAGFRRDPGLSQTLDVSRQLLTEARFLLEASRREGDLAGVERARDGAQAVVEELEEMEGAVGR